MHRCPVCTARDLPRPAPRQRAGPAYGSVLLGDPPSFDEDDTDPHCCVKPLDAVALPSLAATAACRTRHGPAASCSAPMASRLRYLVTVYGPGCLPGHRDCLKRHDSLGFDAGRLLCPLVPREPSERLARPPSAVSGCPPRPQSGAWRIRFDSPPPPVDRAAWRIRAHAGASARRNSAILANRVIAHWHLGVGIHELWRRACTGFPPAVWSPSLSGWLPTTPPQGGSHMAATIAPAPKRHQRKFVITLAATALQADLAHRHYRIRHLATGRTRRFGSFGPPAGSDGALRLGPPALDEHRDGAHHRLASADHRDVGPARPAAPARLRNLPLPTPGPCGGLSPPADPRPPRRHSPPPGSRCASPVCRSTRSRSALPGLK